MTDALITCASVIHITKLVQRVEQSGDANAGELADRFEAAVADRDRFVAHHPTRRDRTLAGRKREIARALRDFGSLDLIRATSIFDGTANIFLPRSN